MLEMCASSGLFPEEKSLAGLLKAFGKHEVKLVQALTLWSIMLDDILPHMNAQAILLAPFP